MNRLEVGQKIKRRRKRLGLTQNELAKYCGISGTEISGMEIGSYLTQNTLRYHAENIIEVLNDLESNKT